MDICKSNNGFNKILYSVYGLILFFCAIIENSSFKTLMLIFASFLLVLILSFTFKVKRYEVKFIFFVLIVINIIIIYITYFTAIKLGYSNGLVRGIVGKIAYYDTSNYFIESGTLLGLWRHGGFSYWILGHMKQGNAFYTYYNFFVIWNALIRFIFGNNLINLILIKLQFSIFSMFFLYKISKLFLKDKLALLSVFIFNIFPSYLLVNTNLMRDNIIIFFILYSSYIFFYNRENLNKKVLIKLLILLCVITYMRVYIGVSIVIFYTIYYYKNKVNLKNIILGCILFFIVVCIIGFIIEKMGYGFLGIKLIENAGSDLNRFNAARVSSPEKVVFWSFYNLILAGKTQLAYNGYICNILNTTTNIFVGIISVSSIVSVLIIHRYKKYREFNNFAISGIIYSLITCMMITFIFSSIIPRLYICWIWVQIIIGLKILEVKLKKNDIMRVIKYFLPTVLVLVTIYLCK